MGRSPFGSKEGLNRGAWTAMEDKMLIDYINIHGEGKWKKLPKNAGLKRCGKSCRLRWLNYLKPDIKRGNITDDEEDLIIRLHKLLGNRWSLIAGRLPGRTDNEIKNYWNNNFDKKLQNQKIPSSRHNPKLLDQPDQDQKPTAANVVRTKASRCSKMVVMPHEPVQNNDDHHQLVGQVVEPMVPLSSSQFTSAHENSSQLIMMDFEMDDHDQLHQSDLFNDADFSQLTNNFIDYEAPSHLSPHDHSDDHTLLLQDDAGI